MSKKENTEIRFNQEDMINDKTMHGKQWFKIRTELKSEELSQYEIIAQPSHEPSIVVQNTLP
jgi:hypothetical protein